MKQTLALGCALALAFGVTSAADAPAASSLPDTFAGRCAAEYIAAFNSGDEAALTKFFTGCFPAASLTQRPVADRLAMTRQIRGEAGALRVEKVVSATDDAIVLLARDGQGQWLELTFGIEPPPSGKLRWIRFEQTDAPDPNEKIPGAAAEIPGALDAYLKKQTQADEFSGVALVARGEKILFHEAYGLASRSFAAPNRKDTKFNLGSINKLFTRIAILQLADVGKLGLEDNLNRFLPDYPNREAAAKITIRQLLDMASGIGDFFGPKFSETPKDRLRTNRDYLPLFAADPLLFEPGADRRYSNGGYVVLGLVVEAASGQNYYDYVRERIFKPSGMKDTDSFEADAPTPNLAEGYTRAWDGQEHPGAPRRSNIYSRPARGSSAGGGYSTAEDLHRFAVALSAGKLLSPAYTAWVLGGAAPGAADVKAPAPIAAPSLGVAGGAPGINAALEIEGDWTVVALANLDPPAAERAARKAMRWISALPAP